MSFGLALTAGIIDAAVGYPDILYRAIGHPVTWIGRLIAWADKEWNSEQDSADDRSDRGIFLVVVLLILSVLLGLMISWLCDALLPQLLAFIATAVLASSLVAQRSLYQHVEAVADALGQGLPQGREAVAMIVGRDISELDEAGVCRAAIESLAESFCDGVVAPTFWAVLFGLPGLLVYKAINTADSMIGHRTERHEAFGWAAARLDDIVNFVPARLAGLLLVVVALVHPEADAGAAWRVMWRDARRHRSPNAGWQEAPLAGALGVALAGPRRYHGTAVDDAWMGQGGRADAGAADIRRGLVLYRLAAALVIVLVAAALVAYKKL